VIARVLDAAVRVPSGGNTQNWRMVVVDDEDTRNELGPLYARHRRYCGGAVLFHAMG
jgi:nitroreductase